MPPRLRERDGGRVRGRAPVRAGSRARSLEALREFVRAIRDEIQQPPPPPLVVVEPVVHKAPAEPRAQFAMREFRRQDPPRFSGEPDPIEVELWLKRINLAFEMIELDEDVLRIRAATYQFSGRALTWWDGLRPGLRGKVVSFELNTFEEGNILRGKGRSIRSDSNSPPILSHSSLSSIGLPLSTSLGVHISQVHPEVDPVRGRDFATSVDKRATFKTFCPQLQTQGQNQQSGQPQLGYKPPSLAISAPPPSSQASRASAPRGQQQQASGGQPRLYAVTNIAPEPSVIRGTFLIFNSWATVLIDTGASCSFIASAFAFALGLEVDLLDSTLLVDTPVGGVVLLNRVCRGCVLVIADRRIEADLVVMDMSGFDIILGMDWLSSNRAIVDCFRRRVTITISSGDSFYFMGDRLDFSTSSLHHLRGRQYILPGT
ncbi:hypothetical protein Acr_22g0002310 [Actinidia rufa]|uniref:Gag protease polyprotein n=1 Tax=Actinidia rufa TaxID=165716 RepID=A0A7J0GJ39_9ERIC|nr:hypothetical protein Acr_22g0002310 [Actinidia rufa]